MDNFLSDTVCIMKWCEHRPDDFKGWCLPAQNQPGLRDCETDWGSRRSRVHTGESDRACDSKNKCWNCVHKCTGRKKQYGYFGVLLLVNLGLCAWLHVQARKHMPMPACVLRRLSCTILLDAKNAWERIGREQGERMEWHE